MESFRSETVHLDNMSMSEVVPPVLTGPWNHARPRTMLHAAGLYGVASSLLASIAGCRCSGSRGIGPLSSNLYISNSFPDYHLLLPQRV